MKSVELSNLASSKSRGDTMNPMSRYNGIIDDEWDSSVGLTAGRSINVTGRKFNDMYVNVNVDDADDLMG